MADAKPFLSQTAQTASFAFRQYFRPLVVLVRFLTSRLAPAEPAEPTAKNPASLETKVTKRRCS
jgi:hypothetical protein